MLSIFSMKDENIRYHSFHLRVHYVYNLYCDILYFDRVIHSILSPFVILGIEDYLRELILNFKHLRLFKYLKCIFYYFNIVFVTFYFNKMNHRIGR